jgi:hypothetical protein
MSPQRRIWIGGVIALVSTTALVAYLVSVGLDKADKIGSAAGLVVAGAGFVLAVLSYRAERGSRPSPNLADPPAGVHNEIAGSHVAGNVVQARDITQPVTLGPPVAPPDGSGRPPA